MPRRTPQGAIDMAAAVTTRGNRYGRGGHHEGPSIWPLQTPQAAIHMAAAATTKGKKASRNYYLKRRHPPRRSCPCQNTNRTYSSRDTVIQAQTSNPPCAHPLPTPPPCTTHTPAPHQPTNPPASHPTPQSSSNTQQHTTTMPPLVTVVIDND